MEGLLIVSEPKAEDIFADTDREYPNEKTALEELSFYEKILATKRIPLLETEITEIPIAGIPYRFFVKRNKLFYQIGFGRLWEGILEKVERRGVEVFQGFIAIPLKKGYRLYEIGSLDGANIYLLLGGVK